MDRKKVMAAVVVLNGMIVILCGCIGETENDIIVMSAWEFYNDHIYEDDDVNFTKYVWYNSLNTGDTLIIRDIIHNISYRKSDDYTFIECKSLKGQPAPFVIAGDITEEFLVGNRIEVTAHIIVVTSTQEIDGEIWTWEMETLQEGWDPVNETLIPLPRKSIHRIETV